MRKQFVTPFTWFKYSPKLIQSILHPHNVGRITLQEAEMSEMRLVIGEAGQVKEGNKAKVYLLVDEDDGLIADAKFQAFGESALIGALQIVCGLILRKNYDQAGRITADMIDKHVRESFDEPAFPEEAYSHLNLALSAVIEATEQCQDIPFASDYVPPSPFDPEEGGQPQYPHFLDLSDEQKQAVLEDVIAKDVRPYVQLDSGGVQVTKINGYQLTVTYEGSCTSCYSATGATLSAIQSILRSKVNPHLEVIPDLSTLTFAKNSM